MPFQTADLVDQFLWECGVRGLAKSTIGQHRWALARLTAHCSELPCDGVALLPVIGDPSLELESRRDVVKCLRTFFGWCGRRHKLPNPCSELDPLPRLRKLPRVLTGDEVGRLMGAASVRRSRSQWQRERDRALLVVALDSGLRVGEVAGLRRSDIGDGWLVVAGKVGVRQVPVSRELSRQMKDLGEGEHIWMGSRGPLTRTGVVQAYKRLFSRAEVRGRRAGAHALRHTFATMYLRHGGGVRQLQTILGHQRIETTMIYVHLAGRDVQADHARHSPARTLGLMDPKSTKKQIRRWNG